MGDIVIVANTNKRMQKLMDPWVEENGKMRMGVNTNKNKTMILDGSKEWQRREIACRRVKLEKVRTFEYMRSLIMKDGSTEKRNKEREKYQKPS